MIESWTGRTTRRRWSRNKHDRAGCEDEVVQAAEQFYILMFACFCAAGHLRIVSVSPKTQKKSSLDCVIHNRERRSTQMFQQRGDKRWLAETHQRSE